MLYSSPSELLYDTSQDSYIHPPRKPWRCSHNIPWYTPEDPCINLPRKPRGCSQNVPWRAQTAALTVRVRGNVVLRVIVLVTYVLSRDYSLRATLLLHDTDTFCIMIMLFLIT